MPSPDPAIARALSVRQPYAEQILLGKKKIEYRSRNLNIRERVYLYASRGEVDEPSEWRKAGAKPGTLPTGVIVGTVEIVGSEYDEDEDWYEWKLARPERLASALTPINQPQPGVWRPQFKADPARSGQAPKKGGGDSMGSTATGITGDLICYHNADVMGKDIWEVTQRSTLSAVCARRYAGAEGHRVWFVAGLDTPRRYYLAGWFTVDAVAEIVYDSGGLDYSYRGMKGHVATRRSHLVEIGTEAWFKDLRRACANFATMQHVRDTMLLQHLEKAWTRTRAPSQP